MCYAEASTSRETVKRHKYWIKNFTVLLVQTVYLNSTGSVQQRVKSLCWTLWNKSSNDLQRISFESLRWIKSSFGFICAASAPDLSMQLIRVKDDLYSLREKYSSPNHQSLVLTSGDVQSIWGLENIIWSYVRERVHKGLSELVRQFFSLDLLL